MSCHSISPRGEAAPRSSFLRRHVGLVHVAHLAWRPGTSLPSPHPSPPLRPAHIRPSSTAAALAPSAPRPWVGNSLAPPTSLSEFLFTLCPCVNIVLLLWPSPPPQIRRGWGRCEVDRTGNVDAPASSHGTVRSEDARGRCGVCQLERATSSSRRRACRKASDRS